MMIILAVVLIAVVAGSFYADYRWRKWMDERRRNRE